MAEEIDPAEAPTGLPPTDGPEEQPLGPPETDPGGTPSGEDAMPGIPTEGEPPSDG